MNIYDKAHELAHELKNYPDVVELRKASEKVKLNETNKKMLDDFRKVQIEAYSEQAQNGKLSKELEEKLQNLYSIVSMNPDVKDYLLAEQKFGVVWEDIMKILNDAINIDLTFEEGK